MNCRSDRCSALGPRPRSSRAMLSMRTGPVSDGTVSRPISAMSPTLVLEHPDLDRILLGPLLVERDLVVAGHGQPQNVADRGHADAQVGGALAIDGHMDFRVRQIEPDLDLGQARQLLRRDERSLGIVGNLTQVGPEDVGGNRKSSGALAAAERITRGDGRPVARMCRQPAPHFRDDLGLRVLARSERERLTQKMDVRRRTRHP